MNKLYVESAPHIHCKTTVSGIMLRVILALLPAAAAGCISYGKKAVLILLTAVGSAVLFEILSSMILGRREAVKDLSCIITGLILGMLLPPDLSLGKVMLGSFIAIVVVKQMFGGIGRNFANPAATAWIVLLTLFRQDMTTWRSPDTGVLTRVTPLTAGGTSYWDLILGNYASYIGTGCALALVLGAVFLFLTNIVSPAAPLACVASFSLLSLAGGYDVLSQILSGSFLLAACFMASDYTTAPLTVSGKIVFGTCFGILTFFIRHYGGYEDGAVFSIVLLNLLTPWINKITRKQPFGAVRTTKSRRRKKDVAA